MGEIYPLQRGEAEGKVEVFRGTQFTLGGRKFTGSYTLKNSSLKKLFPPPSGPAQEKEKREREGTLTKSGAFQYLEGKFSPLDTPTGKVIEEFSLQEQPYGGGLEFGLVFSSVDGIGADFRLQYHRLFRTLRKSVLEGSFIYLPQTLLSREFQQPNRGNMNFHYEEPALFHHKVQGVLDLRWEINRTGKEFHYESYTLTLGPLFRLSSLWEVGTFYTFEAWRIFQVQFPEVDQEGKYLFGGILLTGTYQNLDTPYDPKEGYGLRQELQEVAPSLGGKFQYLLYQGKGIWLKPFFRRFSLVARPRWGYLFEWGDSSSAPRFKRFRLGGPSSLRGYQMERVSPWVKTFAGENVPIGGDRYGGYQSEIRTAITDRLDIAFFLDLLWIAYKKNGILGMGYGPGVLYHTPLGPLSLDLGFKGIPIPTDPSPYVVTFSFFTTL
jgi:outer membrane translocation and assembly module TamA